MKRSTTVGLVGLLAGAASLAAVTAPAEAAPRPAADRPGVHHSTGVDTRAEQDAVRAFWTRARMKAAQPRDVIRPSAKPSGAGGGPKGGTSDPSLGSEWTAGRDTVGKVFFSIGSSNYVCSGNAVDDAQDGRTTPDLVVTAGHCVSSGGEFVTNFMFVPRYSPANPQGLGRFAATSLHTTDQWDAQGADRYNFDVGMARVATVNNQTLAAAVGGASDIEFLSGAADYTVATHSFGYPQARPYDGTKLISCWGTTGPDTLGGSTDYRLPCNMTGGSSGGPWLLDAAGDADPLTNAAVSDVQISVNSFGYRGEKNAMYGPIFGSVVEALYDSVS